MIAFGNVMGRPIDWHHQTECFCEIHIHTQNDVVLCFFNIGPV